MIDFLKIITVLLLALVALNMGVLLLLMGVLCSTWTSIRREVRGGAFAKYAEGIVAANRETSMESERERSQVGKIELENET